MNNGRRSAVWHGIRDIRVEDRPKQSLLPGDVRMAVRSVGVCGSDAHLYYGEHDTDSSFAPFILGHECAGEILEVGLGVSPDRVGQRVAIDPGDPCGYCSRCMSGQHNLCEFGTFFAAPPTDGCMTEEVVVAGHRAYVLPEECSFDTGAMLEPLSCAIAAGRRARIDLGDRVLVTGAGPIGQMCVRIARAMGAGFVVVSDVNQARLAKALDGGADKVVDAKAELLSSVSDIDVVLECSGVAAVAEAAISALGYRGRAVLLGMGLGEYLKVDMAALQAREASVTGEFRHANAYDAATALGGKLALDSLVSHVFELTDVGKAIKTSREDENAIKVVIHP